MNEILNVKGIPVFDSKATGMCSPPVSYNLAALERIISDIDFLKGHTKVSILPKLLSEKIFYFWGQGVKTGDLTVKKILRTIEKLSAEFNSDVSIPAKKLWDTTDSLVED